MPVPIPYPPRAAATSSAATRPAGDISGRSPASVVPGRIKENRLSEVVEELMPYWEGDQVAAAEAPVRAFTRYVSNREGQFHYKESIAAGLPIGSGEIESAHRYVVQQRLKLAGAWWSVDRAEKMLALSVRRANGQWESYWQNRPQKAA